jgi:hypothetical protein
MCTYIGVHFLVYDITIKKISGGDKIFRTCPDGRWGPFSLLYNGYRVSFQGVKRTGRGVDTHPHLAPKLKKESTHPPGLHGRI